MASRKSSSVAANARAVSSCPLAVSRACPSPLSAPAHSANTAPMTATAAATFSPVNAAGNADGAQPVVEVDRDREEADERDEQHLGREAEAEHEDHQRRDHRHGHRLRADHEWPQRA